MSSTRVKVQCASVKQERHYGGEKVQHEIVLDLPYDPSSIYFKLSGGTSITLRTINEDAAKMFEPGKDYYVDICAVTDENTES